MVERAGVQFLTMSLGDYLNSIGRIPLLTTDEEIILGSQVQKMIRILSEKEESELTAEDRKHVRIGRRAKDRMISANLRLVVNVAKKFRPQTHMKMEDMLQEGNIGLMRAVEKFDPERGYKFSTYAYWWIRQGITRAGENQENEIRVPGHIQRIAKNANDAKAKLLRTNGREPTIQEIAEAINEPDCKKIQHALSHQRVTFSLDFRTADGDHSSLIELLRYDDDAEVEEVEELNSRMDLLEMVIQSLDPSDQELICKRHGIGCDALSIKDLALDRNLSTQAIRDRLTKITNKVRLVVRQFV